VKKSFITFSVVFVLLACILLPTTGCTQSQVSGVVAKIVNVLPGIKAANSAVAAVVSVIDPAIAVPVVAFTAVINGGITELDTLCTNYLKSPNTSIWASIIQTSDNLVTNGDAQLLAAARISNPDSQSKATAVIGTLDALLHVLDGWISSTQTPAQVQARAAARSVKLNAVVRYWSAEDKQRVADKLGVNFNTAYGQAVAVGF
jgi:hypothetical protein